MSASRLPPLLCVLAVFTVAGAAYADDGRPNARRGGPAQRSDVPLPGRPLPAQRSERGDPLADAVRRVQSRTGGQVLSAERVPFDGRDINRVKVVDSRGRVRVYMDDPEARSRRGARPTRGNDD